MLKPHFGDTTCNSSGTFSRSASASSVTAPAITWLQARKVGPRQTHSSYCAPGFSSRPLNIDAKASFRRYYVQFLRYVFAISVCKLGNSTSHYMAASEESGPSTNTFLILRTWFLITAFKYRC